MKPLLTLTLLLATLATHSPAQSFTAPFSVLTSADGVDIYHVPVAINITADEILIGKDLILSGEKIHTIREDPADRWRVGMKIHHWMHSPRNPIRGPHQFAEGECMGIQHIHIIGQGNYLPRVFFLSSNDTPGFWLDDFQVVLLATNDGLTPEEFREWFVPSDRPEFIGKIIHFTDFLYTKP